MTFLKSPVGFAATVGILIIAGYAVPRLVIHNDLERLTNTDPKAISYAEDALGSMRHGLCSQLTALICTGVKIVQIRPIRVTPSDAKTFYQTCRYPYEGKAQAYGIFGIPSQEITIDCDGTWSIVEPAS